jgi:hypothetical protein
MSSSELKVPKGPAKKPALSAKKPRVDKPIQVKKPEPLYPLIGTKRVAFIKQARVLSEVLRLTYGDEMTITKFGRILVELQGQKALQGMVYLEQETLEKFHAYQKCKLEMIEEQSSFKSSFSTPSLGTVFPDKVETIFNMEIRSGATDLVAPPRSFREETGPLAPLPPQ